MSYKNVRFDVDIRVYSSSVDFQTFYKCSRLHGEKIEKGKAEEQMVPNKASRILQKARKDVNGENLKNIRSYRISNSSLVVFLIFFFAIIERRNDTRESFIFVVYVHYTDEMCFYINDFFRSLIVTLEYMREVGER